MGFPRFKASPANPIWADFRITQSGWVGKIYATDDRYRLLETLETADGGLVKEYERIAVRTVSTAVYTFPRLLQIRVPRWESRSVVEEMTERVWQHLAPAFDQGDFIPWDMARARSSLLREQSSHTAVYRLGDTRLLDLTSGTATFSPYTADEDLYDNTERRKAIEVLLKVADQCEQLVVNWLPGDGNPLSTQLRTILGTRQSNEIIVGSQTSAAALTYVTDRLLKFAD